MSKLWYRQPASVWDEALPIGNGRMGGMIFGTVETEHIQLNEESMWYGSYVNRNNPDALKYLPEIRKLIRVGEISKAEELMVYALSGTPQSQRPYQTLGDLYISFKGMKGEESSYKRSLSLDDAIHKVMVTKGDIQYKREKCNGDLFNFIGYSKNIFFGFASSRKVL